MGQSLRVKGAKEGKRVGPDMPVPTTHQRREKSGTQICKVRGANSLPKKGEEWDPDMQVRGTNSSPQMGEEWDPDMQVRGTNSSP